MGLDHRKSIWLIKGIYFILISIMLFIASIPFWTLKYNGYPFSALIILSRFFFYIDEYSWSFILLVAYFLAELSVLLFVSLGIFKKLRWMIPFNVILAVDMVLNLISGNFWGTLLALLLVIACNTLARHMEHRVARDGSV